MQTYPLIGNYGVSSSAFESDGPKIEGYVIHELCREPSHWASEISLDKWLFDCGIPGIEGVDTRMLTKQIREQGTMLGILQAFDELSEDSIKELSEEVKQLVHPDSMKLAYSIATKSIKRYDAGVNRDVVLMDCGVKSSIIRNIIKRKFNVTLVPPRTSATKILDMKPAAVVLSNGPGDPKMLQEVIETTRELVETRIPILGICLGAQILALSFGADTYKLKFGHRGQNHPCIDLRTKRCFITSQNHSFAVNLESLKGLNIRVRLINANDKTIEGFEHEKMLVKAFQFHPESSPGPNDTNFIFTEFFKNVLASSSGVNRA